MIAFNVQTERKRVRVVLQRRKTSGPFYACFWWKGKRYRESTGKMFEPQARASARDMVLDRAGRTGERLTIETAIADSLAERFPTDESRKEQHHVTTKAQLSHFAEKHKGLDLGSLSFESAVQVVQKYLDGCKASDAPQTVIHRQRKLSRLFSWLIQRRRVSWQANPASKDFLELPTVFRQPRPPVSQDELKILLTKGRATTIWPAVLLCITTGMRPAGTLRLRWSDFNASAKTLRVFEKRRERFVPLNDWTVDELTVWKAQKGGGETDRILDMKRQNLHQQIQNLRRANNLRDNVTLQGCRRTFISLCMDAGISAELVASIAGNSVAVIEKHYKDLRTMNARNVVNLLDLRGLMSDTAPKAAASGESSAS